MMEFCFDIAIIGAGHAGIEAALAAAKLGCSVVCFCTQLDAVGNLPCNPAIGGTAKGHLVREIDALGGMMGIAADACCIQYRMLNRGKGPAVHSLRAQADRVRYKAFMKHALERQEGLSLRQAEIVSVRVENEAVSAVVTASGVVYSVGAVVVATGTFLGGRVITGDLVYPGGPDGLAPSLPLAQCLEDLGLSLRRFKTGTPPRVSGRGLQRDKMVVQAGESTIPFSFETEEVQENAAVCYQTWTNEETHRILRDNLHRSPLYSGVIEGVGPRYCPSIEDKVVRFADKTRHPVFCEPMGLQTEEYYLQGLSSSMPEDVQWEVLHSIVGLEQAQITRPAYAIEYDCVDPLCLEPTLQTKLVRGLFGAGQFCGSSGYEEAAAQGLLAGINAARLIQKKDLVILPRSGSYIGTLIDDLVTRGTEEPYRMMTSRSEHRLLLRQDNADERLSALGYEIGLLSGRRYLQTQEKYERVKTAINKLGRVTIPPSPVLTALLTLKNSSLPTSGIGFLDLLRRPEICLQDLLPFDPALSELSPAEREQIEIKVKYEGYIRRQNTVLQSIVRMEQARLPSDIDYSILQGLRIEARQKLSKVRPENLGQASRISGVSPADMTALMLYLQSKKEGHSS